MKNMSDPLNLRTSYNEMKTLTVIICLFVMSTSLWATSQIPEKMNYDGESFGMYSTPLDAYLGGPDKLPPQFRQKPSPTDCHRGYIGSWKIVSGRLYLLSVVLGYERDREVPLNQIGVNWKAPVFAGWFSGTIRLQKGDLVTGGTGFSEFRAEEILIAIKEGIVTEVQTKTNKSDNAEQAPERTLLPASGITQEIADPQDIAARIESLAASSNFHSGEMGGMNLKPPAVQDEYRKYLASGRYMVVRYGKPHSLRITGNRDTRNELSVHELVVGFTEDRMPSALFAITGGNELLALSKFRGDLAVQIQKTLAAPANGEVRQDAAPAQLSSDKEESRLSISPADYKVVSVAGSFGTYGIPGVGDVVRFDPNKILDEKPRTLKFKSADDRLGPAYLNLPEFRLERVLNYKGHDVGYSFFCRRGIQPGGPLLRFDLRTDWDKMFVVHEWNGIVHGVLILEKMPREAK